MNFKVLSNPNQSDSVMRGELPQTLSQLLIAASLQNEEGDEFSDGVGQAGGNPGLALTASS